MLYKTGYFSTFSKNCISNVCLLIIIGINILCIIKQKKKKKSLVDDQKYYSTLGMSFQQVTNRLAVNLHRISVLIFCSSMCRQPKLNISVFFRRIKLSKSTKFVSMNNRVTTVHHRYNITKQCCIEDYCPPLLKKYCSGKSSVTMVGNSDV